MKRESKNYLMKRMAKIQKIFSVINVLEHCIMIFIYNCELERNKKGKVR